MNLNEIKTMFDFAMEEKKDVTDMLEAIATVVQEYAHIFKPVADNISDYMLERRIKAIQKMEAAGFTREEAIVVTNDERLGFRYLLDRIKVQKNR